MTLEEFIIKNKIDISPRTFEMAEEAVRIMERSIDPLHNEKHIFRMLDDLDCLLKEEKAIDQKKINFEVLLLAIFWHDIWRSYRFPLNVISLLFGNVRDGKGSMTMFSKIAEVVGLDKQTTKEVKYAIRKHSSLQFLPLKTVEGKLLKDLDGLEEWSWERIQPLKEKYLVFGTIDLKLLRLAKFYFDHFMVKDAVTSFYFDWSKKEFSERKKAYLKEVKKLLEEYKDLFDSFKIKVKF